ncbi:MAG: MFS transporter [Desulfomonilaceae bacterium]|nr:MFS transporter [Desulfomonilaceae bacterium]
MKQADRILSPQFLALSAVMFLTFCNLAVFFQFELYLGTLNFGKEWSGFVIGVFSLTVLVVRPIISPFLYEGNSRFWIVASTCGIIVSLLLYDVGTSPLRMSLVRIAHGLTYVILATAVLSALVSHIPPKKSAQAFGLLSVLTLLPYAVIPPLLNPLETLVGGFSRVLDLFAAAMILVFPIMFLVGRNAGKPVAREDSRIQWADFTRNMLDARIILLMSASLLVWTSFTVIFYYLKGYGETINIGNPGWFFTLSTLSEIGVRLVAGPMLDRYDKSRFLTGASLWLAVSYFVMTFVSGEAAFYAMGIVFGLGWGVTMPMLSGLVFDISEPKLRAMNTNLSMEMFQGGYFLGPVVGGVILMYGGYEDLFFASGGIMVVAFMCAVLLMKSKRRR